MPNKYDFQISDINDRTSHGLILKQINPGSTVLECGCAAGYMTRYIKEVIGSKVFVIERDPESCDKAMAFADDGICSDLENNEWIERYSDKRFDYILFADVLEHLCDPETVLAKAVSLLKDDGKVLLSIPNIGHDDILVNLYLNRWNYMPLGLLDNTHVHFWGRENLYALFDSAGLAVTIWDYVILPPFRTEQAPKDISLDQIPGLEELCSRKYGDVYQFVLTAQKKQFVDKTGIMTVDNYSLRHEAGYALPQELEVYINHKHFLMEEEKKQAQNLHDSLQSLSLAHQELMETNVSLTKELLSEIETRKENEKLIKEIQFDKVRQSEEIEQLRSATADQKNELEKLGREKRALEDEMRSVIQNAEKSRSLLAEKDSQIDAIHKDNEAAVANLQFELAQTQNAYNIISNAFFWKITKPFRITLDFVKSIAGKSKFCCVLWNSVKILKNKIAKTRQMNKHLSQSEIPEQVFIGEIAFPATEITETKVETRSLVSVVMPCYNDGMYIQEAIGSVLRQTYDPIEIIVVDDGSDDEFTLNLLPGLENEQIRLIHTDHVGPSAARNAAIRAAQGEYILPLDADDAIEPDYIEKAAAALSSDGSIGVVYCRADYFGEKEGPWQLPPFSAEKMMAGNMIFVTSLFRREDWERLGGFREGLKYGLEDWDFWLSLLQMGKKVIQIPEVLFHYRIKPVSRTSKFNQNIMGMQETYRSIYEAHVPFYQQHSAQYLEELRSTMVGLQFLNQRLTEEVADSRKEAVSTKHDLPVKNLSIDPIYIMTPEQTLYLAGLIAKSLKKAGINCVIGTTEDAIHKGSLHIVICPQVFSRLPEDYVVYQMEQTVSSRWLTEKYMETLRNARWIYDYSLKNVSYFSNDDIISEKIYYLPLDYYPQTVTQIGAPYQHDVLFYGDINNEHRRSVIENLRERNYDVHVVCGTYGTEMAAILTSSKIVLNLHYYDNALLETTRIYEVLSYNRSIVISEKSADPVEDAELKGVVDFVDINEVDQIAERIDFWLSNEDRRIQKLADNAQRLLERGNRFEPRLYESLLHQGVISYEEYSHIVEEST